MGNTLETPIKELTAEERRWADWMDVPRRADFADGKDPVVIALETARRCLMMGEGEGVMLEKIEEQKDLPAVGETYRCSVCGTRIRSGQPHTAERPVPHQTYAALIVEMSEAQLAETA